MLDLPGDGDRQARYGYDARANNAPTSLGTLLTLDRNGAAGRTVVDAQVTTAGASSPLILTGGFNNRAADGSKIDPLTAQVTFANTPSQLDVHVDSDTCGRKDQHRAGDQRIDDHDRPRRRGQGRCKSFPAGHHQPVKAAASVTLDTNTGVLDYQGSAGLDSLDVTFDSEEPFVDSADNGRLILTDVPADLSLGFADLTPPSGASIGSEMSTSPRSACPTSAPTVPSPTRIPIPISTPTTTTSSGSR